MKVQRWWLPIAAAGMLVAVGLPACGGDDGTTDPPPAPGTGGTTGDGGGTGGTTGTGGKAGTGGSGGKATGGAGGQATGGAGGQATGGAGGQATGGAGGTAQTGHTGMAMAAGGEVLKSANYRLIVTLGEAPGGNGVSTSGNYKLRGGLVGATQ